MQRIVLLGVLLGMVMLGFASRSSAATIPSVKGLQPFSVQTNYMSLAGFLRWQYFVENNKWISFNEAARLVKKQ